MRRTLQLILYVAVAAALTVGCTGKRSQTAKESDRQSPATDTTYTQQAAMAVHLTGMIYAADVGIRLCKFYQEGCGWPKQQNGAAV